MRERPILFNADMVRAVLDGRKTQTRRIMKNQPVPSKTREGDFWFSCNKMHSMVHVSDFTPGNCLMPDAHEFFSMSCPFGAVGDRLWVRETCQAVEHESGLDVVRYPADGNEIPVKAHPLDAGRWVDLYRYRGCEGKIVPSIHMPRWASRITLEITGVRVERLQDISVADMQAEGMRWREEFPCLWETIYGEESWKANPWVWVVEFKRVEVD